MSSTESYIQNLFADRLGGNQFGKDTKIYKFEKIKRAKRAALEANPGKELFDMGVGDSRKGAAIDHEFGCRGRARFPAGKDDCSCDEIPG